jgi:hypothetical protein
MVHWFTSDHAGESTNDVWLVTCPDCHISVEVRRARMDAAFRAAARYEREARALADAARLGLTRTIAEVDQLTARARDLIGGAGWEMPGG